jgi:predicted nucleotidyltransferase
MQKENENEQQNSSNNLQLEKFLRTKKYILDILENIEKEYDVDMLYCSETGSRALGTDSDSSAYEITGFFITKPENYYKIIKTYNRIIEKKQDILIIDDIKFDLNLELWDIKEWFHLKVTKNLTGCDYWFNSPLIYINKFPDIIEEIKKYLLPPYLLYWGKAKSGINFLEKEIKLGNEILNKEIINIFVALFQYLHTQLYMNYPIYNILDELDFINENKSTILEQKIYNEDEYNVIETTIDKFKEILNEKRKDRMSKRKDMPNDIYIFMKLLESKYNTHKKKYELTNLLKENSAQDLFNNFLELQYDYKF